MRKIIGTVLGAFATSALLVATLASAAPASANTSGGRHLYPLAGNDDYLVYSQNSASNGSLGLDGCSHGRPTLHVRTKAGRTRTLSVPHMDHGLKYDDDANPCYGLDLTGHLLTMEGVSGSTDPMYWWDLNKHTHGKVRLPGSDIKIGVVGTVAGGWLYVHLNDSDKNYFTATTLYRQGTDGKVTTYARLPRFSVYDVVTSPRGLLTGRDAQPLRYTRVGSSTTKTLDRPAHLNRGNGCFALTATFAACESVEESDLGRQHSYQVSITPLSGGRTISSTHAFDATTSTIDEDDISATPNGIVDLVYRSTASSGLNRAGTDLRSFGTDGRVRSAHSHGGTTLVVAYGEIVVAHRGGKLTIQRSVTGKQHTLIGTR